MEQSPQQVRERAVDLSAETMGELMAFWGFKASMGRIWTLLYLSPEPLPADVIATRTQLSAGAVSMALAELQQWGIVDRAVQHGERKRHFKAETDVWGIVRRIVRARELRLVGRSVQRFSEAVELLEESLRAHPDDAEAAFMVTRLRGLLGLSRIGYRLVESFAEAGMFTLDPIKGALKESGDAYDPSAQPPAVLERPPLYDPDRRVQVDLRDAVHVARAFLLRCRAWGAQDEIPRRLAALVEDPTPARAASLHSWTLWVAFVDHAVAELERGELDHWFTDADGL